MSGPVLRASLAPHPSTPCAAVRSIDVRVVRHSGRIELSYRIEADPGRIRLPRRAAPRQADELWRHTCFEAFVMPDPGPAYGELNFSPSGEWACYGFERYREGMSRLAPVRAPSIMIASQGRTTPAESSGSIPISDRRSDCAAEPGRWLLRASVELDALAGGAAARAALAAVIEESDGRLCYWALAHPPGGPDFHHAAGFALRI